MAGHRTLRQWQQKAIIKALKKYESHDSHFMCVASPGAGKTLFAANIAKALLDKDRIDFVVCIAPSLSVLNGIKNTFAEVLNDDFNGRLGSLGLVITYQSINSQFDPLEKLIEKFRLLVISDEIHHLSFGNPNQSNNWGKQLSKLVSKGKPLTLSLSGTPWRSDSTKIALQNYFGDPEELQIDYIYGLKDAVRDRVCRKPSITLLDNKNIVISDAKKTFKFESISQAIGADKLKYNNLLIEDQTLKQLLDYSSLELLNIRLKNPHSAGLVVASSVEQASRISGILQNVYGYSTLLVCYNRPDSQDQISKFQQSKIDWIVSVGMVSEGTDIPRLQVCAYLSNIRTELYFRQVLGRILRVNNHWDEQCSLIAFAEPKLFKYSERIGKDIPNCTVKIVNDPNIRNQVGENLSFDSNEASATKLVSGQKDSYRLDSLIQADRDGRIQTNKTLLCNDSYRTIILSL